MTLSSKLKGQRVLVTAASQGIGFGAAKAFLEEGASVVINSSNSERLNSAQIRLKTLGRVEGIVADLSKKEDIERLVKESRKILGGIDTLVYVTGSPPPGVFMEKNFEDWVVAAQLLTVSPAYLSRRVAEVMIADGTKGRIVLSASYAIREPVPTIATSNVCRIAIAGIVRTLARELGAKGIRVNAVLPGYIQTPRVDQITLDIAKRRGISQSEALSAIEKDIPLGRVGTTEELARSIVFLGSDMSAYVTGAMLPVDGGLLRSVG